MKKKAWPPIRKRTNASGTVSWCVDAGCLNGNRERHYFPTKAEADTKADQLRVRKLNEGSAGLTLSDSLRAEAKKCSEELSWVGATITEATAFFLKHAKPPAGHKTSLQVVAEFLKAKEKAGRKETYLSVQKYVLKNVFCAEFGKRMIHEISHTDLETWIAGKDWAIRTRKNYHTDLSNFFGYAVKRGYCATNPLVRMEKPTVTGKPPGILTVQQSATLLTAAESLNGGMMLPAIAIGLFAGLRSAEIERLDWRHVNLTAKTIEVTAENAKTRERRIVEISDNLLEWLRPYAKREGKVAPDKSFDWRLKQCWQAARIPSWPHNACRHTFASMYYAHHKNAAATSAQLGHFMGTDTMVNHYRNLVTPSDAALFWALGPGAPSNLVSMPAAAA